MSLKKKLFFILLMFRLYHRLYLHHHPGPPALERLTVMILQLAVSIFYSTHGHTESIRSDISFRMLGSVEDTFSRDLNFIFNFKIVNTLEIDFSSYVQR